MKKLRRNFIKLFFLSIFSMTYSKELLAKKKLDPNLKIKKKKIKKFYWYLKEND